MDGFSLYEPFACKFHPIYIDQTTENTKDQQHHSQMDNRTKQQQVSTGKKIHY